MSQTTTYTTCITLFSTFAWRSLHFYDMKPPNEMFRRRILLSLSEPGWGIWEFNSWSHAAHLKNQLTNGTAANWAKEVVFILFRVLWRCQPCIIMNTISNNYYFLVLKVSSKLLRQLKWHYAITSGTYFTSTLITFFFEKLPYLLLNLFNWYLTCSAYIWTPP